MQVEILPDAEAAAARAQEQAAPPQASPWDRQPEPDDGYRNARRYDGGGYREEAPRRAPSSRSDSIGTAMAKSFARQLGTRAGQAVVRGILGSLFKSR